MATTYYNEADTKKIYRVIMKLIHPDMNPGKSISDSERTLVYEANDAYAEHDYWELKRIYDKIKNLQNAGKHEEAYGSMIEYFRSMNLEVIDKRDKGGCLWVIGDPNEINEFVRTACRMFHAGGNYAMNGGRASSYRTAWFTRCGR